MRQEDLKKKFVRHNRQIFRLFENTGFFETLGHSAKISRREEFYMLLLAPLVEVAWADGRVTSRESDAILQTADSYGLTESEDLYCLLMETMITRPSPKTTARAWHQLQQLLVRLPGSEFDFFAESLLVQAQFVAEQSSNNLIGFLRGDGICRDEETVLQKIGEELNKARVVRAERAGFYGFLMKNKMAAANFIELSPAG